MTPSNAAVGELSRPADAGSRRSKGLNTSGVSELLKEYTSKLQNLSGQAIQLRKDALNEAMAGQEGARFYESNDFFKAVLGRKVAALRPVIKKLASAVSQMIENGKLGSTIERVELEVRLADLESELRSAQDLIDRPFPQPRKK